MEVIECQANQVFIRFSLDDHSFEVELSRAEWALIDMLQEAVSEAPGNDDLSQLKQDRLYYEKVAAWLEETGKIDGYEVSLGQAKQIQRQIRDAVAEHKKKLESSRTSPLPTSSTPASSLPTSSTPSTPISTDSTPNKSVDSDEPQPSSPQSESMT